MMIESGTALRDTRESIGLSQAKLAEITGIPQYILSAFELGKSELDTLQIRQLKSALNDKSLVTKAVKRKKRYQAHAYSPVIHDATRVTRQIQTPQNAEYVSYITSLHSQKAEKKYRALSLFSGCGGLSLGFSWAGFEIKGFLEIDQGLREIYAKNFPASKEIGADITDITDDQILDLKKKTGDIDIIIGGPPCQGFSLSGKRDVNDPRNTLFLHYLRFVDVYRPKIAVMENVRLLTSMKSHKGNFVKDDIKSEFKRRGYSVEMFDVNAKDYGVPQHRERVFFIAIREDTGIRPCFPEATHGDDNGRGLFSNTKPCLTFADACSDLPYLESGESSNDPFHEAVSHPQHVIDWLWDVREGYSAHENEDPKKRPPSGYNTTYKRQVWREPAATIQTTFGMISGCRNVHPIATRSLTVREAARLQSFPDDYKFSETLGTTRTGIGNAVPPLLAYVIASNLISKVLNLIKISSL
jgi:DNA (cytosine-5)-methyltransferase 1